MKSSPCEPKCLIWLKWFIFVQILRPPCHSQASPAAKQGANGKRVFNSIRMEGEFMARWAAGVSPVATWPKMNLVSDARLATQYYFTDY